MQWLVTVATGQVHTNGPCTLVEADTVEEAATIGLQQLIAEDEGSHSWGVACQHCEGVAIESLHVYSQASATEFEISESVVKR